VLGKAAPIQRRYKGTEGSYSVRGGIGPSSASDKAKEALETFSIADDGSLVDQNCKKILSGTDCEATLYKLLRTWRILGAYYSRPLVGGPKKLQRESMSKCRE
jgi:hypothetical protein